VESAWTVKADPDTVWVPQRLRDYLGTSDASVRLVVRNQGGGYLGPLEVFSVAAVWDFANRHRGACMKYLDTTGEDGWVASCMLTLGATFQSEWSLLKSSNDTGACRSSPFIAHHPFKNVWAQQSCYDALR